MTGCARPCNELSNSGLVHLHPLRSQLVAPISCLKRTNPPHAMRSDRIQKKMPKFPTEVSEKQFVPMQFDLNDLAWCYRDATPLDRQR